MATSKSYKAGTGPDTLTVISCFRVVAIMAAGVVFALLVDVADFGKTLALFLSVSGLLRGTAAAIAADEFWAKDLNRWDEAAILIMLGMLLFGITA